MSEFGTMDGRTKGFPGDAPPVDVLEIAARKWNILHRDMPLPIAVLREKAIEENGRFMREFCASTRMSLAPHGKTTMCPQIFRRQIADGAWAITLSTPHQVHVARDFGIDRILFANQLVDPVFIRYVCREQARCGEFEFICLVDSVEGAGMLNAAVAEFDEANRVDVLVELGADGGRTGVRSAQAACELIAFVRTCPQLRLRGVEGFEGAVPGASARETGPVTDYLQRLVALFRDGLSEGWFEGEALLSVGGSSFYDLVEVSVRDVLDMRGARVVLRSGCYIAHDSQMYRVLYDAIRERSETVRDLKAELRHALEVVAYVQSVPEPNIAILTAGKRDLSYDIHLPTPLRWHRPSSQTGGTFDERSSIIALNDQHAFLRFGGRMSLMVGDMVWLGVSHPCTTFDKWDVLYGVDDDYTVTSAYKTFF